jgi:hypothetical protein
MNRLEDATTGDLTDVEGFGQLRGPDDPVALDPLHIKTKTLNAGGFIQDSWSVLDKVTINAGIRYDVQQLYAASGALGLSLPNQWSPRIGVIWDPTQEGHAKVFGNYARYYESVPLALNDLTLSGQPSVLGTHPASSCTADGKCTQNSIVNDPANPSRRFSSFGAGATPIDPDIKPTSSDEIVIGGEYEILKNARLGATYTRRWLNSWIEDFSRDNLQTFDLGNPGYGIASDFPKAQRNYDAVTMYFAKAFGDQWLAQASWTISSLRGNIGGLFRSSTSQLDPNHNADFDQKAFTINQYGPLPGDHTHDIKAFLARDWQVAPQHSISTGVALRGKSGEPINFYGGDENYGPGINLLLPRGSGGRLPWNFGSDLNVAYRYSIDKDKSISFTVDVFNVFNFQAITSVDEQYTQTNALGRQNGSLADARTQDGGRGLYTSEVNPNYRSPTSYQSPRVFRFGIRSTF